MNDVICGIFRKNHCVVIRPNSPVIIGLIVYGLVFSHFLLRHAGVNTSPFTMVLHLRRHLPRRGYRSRASCCSSSSPPSPSRPPPFLSAPAPASFHAPAPPDTHPLSPPQAQPLAAPPGSLRARGRGVGGEGGGEPGVRTRGGGGRRGVGKEGESC